MASAALGVRAEDELTLVFTLSIPISSFLSC